MKLNEVIIILKRLYKNYIKVYLPRLLVALFLSVIVAVSTSSIAWLLDPAIKKIFIDKDPFFSMLIPLAIVLSFSAKGISLYFARLNVIKVGNWICGSMQKQLSEKILISDNETLESKHSAKYISNFLYDTGLVSQLVSSGVLNIMKDSLTLITLVGVMFYQNWKLAIFSLIMIPLATIVARSLGKRIGKATTASTITAGKLSTWISEMIRGTKIIKIYQNEKLELQRSDEVVSDHVNNQIKIGSVLIRATPIMEILTGIMIAIFISYSGVLIANGEIGVNNFFSFLTAMMLSYQPVRSLATINMLIYQGSAGAKRVFEILDKKIEIKDDKTNVLKIQNSDIKFQNVSFNYKTTKKKAVSNINLNIKGGSLSALVGHSGAGKSTILNLIPRFYDCQNGQILIDNQNIYSVSIKSLRQNIALVSQDVILFDDTVEANILYAKPNATFLEIEDACTKAAADDFIKELPNGYKTLIGENGIKLSGGQKQRLSIARALLKNSPIILLDEATSSLDTDSEKKVQNAISNLTRNRTTLVIAHRLSTILNADQIFVMKGGSILDSGNHKELLQKSSEYKSLYEKQIN